MKHTILLLLIAAGMAAGAQKTTPVVNQNVTVKNCDILWSRNYISGKSPEQIIATIKMEGIFATVDMIGDVVYGTINPFKVPRTKATVSWIPMWLIDPITATVQFKKTADGYNVLFKKIKIVAENYKGDVTNLPESDLLDNYALKNCEFIKAFVKQGCTDMLDDGFNKKVMDVFADD